MERVVAVGEWLYDGTVPTRVLIVQTDYDFWHVIGEASGDREPDERPALNDEGHSYYIRHKPGWSEGAPFWPDSQGHRDLDSAKAAAEASLPSPVSWR